MKRKGQMNGLGAFIVTFVAIIVALALFNPAITTNVAGTTDTQVFNSTSGSGAITATNGGEIDLQGKVATGLTAVNASSDTVATTNYTVIDNKLVNGVLTARLNFTADAVAYHGNTWNVTYTYQPDGYITDAGGRAIANLILIFAALAIFVVALVPTFRSGVLNLIGR